MAGLPEDFPVLEEVLLPSGSAALYRRAMLDQIGGFDDDFFLYCEDTDLGLRARWAGWKCLYVPDAVVEHHYSHSAGARVAIEGILRGAQPAVRAGEEFSRRDAAGGAVRVARALFVARRVICSRDGAAPPASAPKATPVRAWRGTSCERMSPCCATPAVCGGSAARSARGARITPHIFRAAAAQPLDQPEEAGRALMRAGRPRLAAVIVPAVNEEGAVGAVVRSIRAYVPGVPVLVIDDCSSDAHHCGGRAAPAPTCCRCRTISGSAAACRPGTSWPTSSGFEYVIRVDGDGQHDARDIPRVFETPEASRVAKW